jgi:molybdenum cofactor biosynthesis enzyme MoaA
MINISKRLEKQKLFDIDSSNFKNLGGWSIYNNANLSIHLGEKCNANCDFCIAHLRYLNENKEYKKPFIEDDEKYINRLNAVLDFVKPINPSVSITGGEPTLYSRFPLIVASLKSHNVRKRTMTTNASGLLNSYNNKTYLQILEDYKLEYLNISRAHYDETINAQIMHSEKLPANEELKEIIGDAELHGISVRLSCILLKDHIGNFTEIQKYIRWAQNIGVKNVIFRQLMNFDKKNVACGRIPDYCLKQNVELYPIWQEFDKNPEYDLYHQVLGYYYYVEIRKFENMNIVTEGADLRLIKPMMKKYKEKYKKPIGFEMVFHPNGNLCTGWQENEMQILC